MQSSSAFSPLRIVGLLAGLSPFIAPGAFAQTIPLTVTENAGVSRASEPVTTGVPIAANQVGASWSLFDGSTEIPVQTTVLPGRTVPWLLLDFQTSLVAGQTRTLTLKPQFPAFLATQTITINETPLQITVTTGPLRTQLSTSDFNLLDNVWIDRDGSGTFGSSEQVVRATSSSNLTVRDAATSTVFSGRGQPRSVVWEYRGPLRATLRVDGGYVSGPDTLLTYTTRMTWYAGQTYVRIEHVIRNSLPLRERYVKLSSALLLAGATAATARVQHSGSLVWSNATASGAALELIPQTLDVSDAYDPFANPPVWRHNVTIDVDGNGGMIVGDLSHHGATWQVDFADPLSAGEAARRARVFADPLMALADESGYSDLGAFGQLHFSSYGDEKNAYRKWGWTWPTAGNPLSEEHHLAREQGLYPSWSVLDSDLDPESDDLYDNIVLYARVQIPAFLDRLRAWTRYSKWEWAYRTDGFAYAGAWGDFYDGPGTIPRTPRIAPPLTALDQAYIDHDIKHGKGDPNHMWNGGLLDAYYLTGDRDALEAAIDVAEQVRRYFGWQNLPTQYVGGNARFPARALLVLTRTWEATGDPQWKTAADHLVTMFVGSPGYDPRGFYFKPTSELAPVDAARFSSEGKIVTPLMMSSVVEALYRYFLSTGDATVRSQLLQIATFWRDHGLDPATGYGGDIVIVDSPAHGDVSHLSYSQFANIPPINPYTVASSSECFVNALTIGYRLTGDLSYLRRAKLYWNQGSKRSFTSPYDQRFATDTQVGRFANSLQESGPTPLLFPEGGDWARVSLLFYEAAREDDLAPNRILDFVPR
jgi:hypothetical protein